MCTIFGCPQMCSYKKEANSLSTNVLPIVGPIVVAQHAILEVVLKSPVIQKLFPYSCLSSYEVLQDEQGLIFSWLGGLDSILRSDPRVVTALQSGFMVESCLIVKARPEKCRLTPRGARNILFKRECECECVCVTVRVCESGECCLYCLICLLILLLLAQMCPSSAWGGERAWCWW